MQGGCLDDLPHPPARGVGVERPEIGVGRFQVGVDVDGCRRGGPPGSFPSPYGLSHTSSGMAPSSGPGLHSEGSDDGEEQTANMQNGISQTIR